MGLIECLVLNILIRQLQSIKKIKIKGVTKLVRKKKVN